MTDVLIAAAEPTDMLLGQAEARPFEAALVVDVPLRSHRLSAIVRVPERIARSSAGTLLGLLRDHVEAAGLTAMDCAAADFHPHGASVLVLLKESHVALHVWPERGRMTVDIHVCDFTSDNLVKATRLAEELGFADFHPANRTAWSVQSVTG
jgi:S-adenosylmethionine/arginine decarboxylase-like enzyme